MHYDMLIINLMILVIPTRLSTPWTKHLNYKNLIKVKECQSFWMDRRKGIILLQIIKSDHLSYFLFAFWIIFIIKKEDES